jgi:hypothetical protein
MSEFENKPSKKNRSSTNSLSSTGLQKKPKKIEDKNIEEVRDKVFLSINNEELQKSLDAWMKKNLDESRIQSRDLHILKSIITEYLDTYILFGYDTNNQRIVIQNCENPRDRDALMEFLKIIFIKQQNENFLDNEGDDF